MKNNETKETIEENVKIVDQENASNWFKVSEVNVPKESERIHVRLNGRYITVFRNRAKLSAIDSICHHAGGPLTLGPLQDIEELGMTVVLCPWHKFMVSIDGGLKAYKAVDVSSGRPVVTGWTAGKIVQRPHEVVENDHGVFVRLNDSTEACSSDQDAFSSRCAQDYPIYIESTNPTPLP